MRRRALDLSPDVRARVLSTLGDTVLEHLDGDDGAVTPAMTTDEVRERIGRLDFDAPLAPDDAMEQVTALLRDGIVHTGHPRYFGLFNPRPAFMGIAGDLLTALFNPQLAATSHAPAAVELERHVVATFARWLGLPERTEGSFTSGGAEANHTAVLVALQRMVPGVASGGLRAASGQPVLYASADSHLAWLKIAHATGLGRDAVRLIGVDESSRMEVGALRDAIRADRAAGRLPFLVVGTFGTTSSGTIDPLDELAALCAAERLHLHVDAAWGGAICVSDRLRPLLAGCERADTVTLDAHKWLSAPMGAGMLLSADPAALAETFAVTTGYMPDPTEAAPDPYSTTMQWSRRAIGVKVALTLLTAGRSGHATIVEQDCDLGDRLRSRLCSDGWEIVNDTPLPVVCFVDPDHDDAHHQRIADEIVRSGRAWLSTVPVGGRRALRACVISHATTQQDVDAFADELQRFRSRDDRRCTSKRP
ncbi:MAG: pyridoxal phosphate-dependent decarboxylase family protein [Nocardioidaceae bacterium]